MFNLFIIAWFLICLLCLRDAWRCRTALHPLFGSNALARSFWIVLIALVNPVLILLYAVFGRFRRTGSMQPALRHGIVLIVAGWAIWMQLGGAGTPHTTGEVKQEGVPTTWSLSLGRAEFHQKGQNTMTTQRFGPLAPRTLRILFGDDELSRACARLIAKDLANEWWTDSVVLWPENTNLPMDVRAPDYIINVSSKGVTGGPFPIMQAWEGSLVVTGSCSSYPMGSTSSYERLPGPGSLEYQGETKFRFRRIGVALGASVRGDLAKSLAGEVHKSLIDKLRKEALSGLRIQPSPHALHPRKAPVPKVLAAKDLVTLGSEFSPHVHERTWFRFDDRRPTETVLLELDEALETVGWTPSWGKIIDGEFSVLRMDHGGLQLTVGRWPRPEWRSTTWINGVKQEQPAEPVSDSPFIATLVSYFTEEEYEALAQTYSQDPVNLDGLLEIHGQFKNEDSLRALQGAMHATPRPDIGYWIKLARLDHRLGNLESAQRSVQTAHCLSALDHSSTMDSMVESCAEDLETDLDSITDEMAHRLLQDSGLLELSPETGTLEFLMDVGQQIQVLQSAEVGSAPSRLTVQIHGLNGPKALYLSNQSSGMGTSQSTVLGGSRGIYNNNLGFHVQTEVVGDQVSLRVSNR